MGAAIASVMPNVAHGLCTWHITENAKKHLSSYNKGDTDYVAEFRACVYNYEDEEEFETAFRDLESKLGLTWFPFVYKDKKKWAYCYMKNVFCLGVRSTQLSESLNKDLKNYLKSDLDIVRFLRHFERVVNDKREKEVNSEFACREKKLRVKVNVPILIQMSKVYTQKIFDIFQSEYELCMAAQIEGPIENCYIVTICNVDEVDSSSKGRKVIWDPTNETVSCNCKKFERWGILCCHALKVLDTMNIKLLPEKYVLKRWTREARICVVRDRNGTIVIDPKLDATRRNRYLCRKFVQMSAKASPSEELSSFLDGILDQAGKHIDMKIQALPNISENIDNTSLPPDLEKMLTENPPRLKKRNGKKGTRRKLSWVERLSKKSTEKKNPEVSKKKP